MDRIIINADDFGLTDSCTDAICRAFKENLITDTSMVANGEAFGQAIDAIEKNGLHDKIGVHFNLTEGKPLTETIASLASFARDGHFHGRINRLKRLSKAEQAAVYEELSAQIEKLENAGVEITHADSHHHIHTGIFIAPIFAKVCKEHGIKKVRLHRNIGSISMTKRIIKKIYNTWLHANGFKTAKSFGSMEDVELIGVSDNLEIMVHPEYDKDGKLIDKIDEQDGCAVGKPLTLPSGDFTLKGYKNL